MDKEGAKQITVETFCASCAKAINGRLDVGAQRVTLPNRTFSDFIRNASVEEKTEVYAEVMEKASERQWSATPGVCKACQLSPLCTGKPGCLAISRPTKTGDEVDELTPTNRALVESYNKEHGIK